MPIIRLFAILAVVGLILAAVLPVNATGTASKAKQTGTTVRENIAERTLEMQDRKRVPRGSKSVSVVRENITERTLEMQDRKRVPGVSNGAGTVRENITERTLLFQKR